MLQSDGTIEFSASELLTGIADSPYIGNGRIVNLDIWSAPGIAKVQLRTLEVKSVPLASQSTVGPYRSFAVNSANPLQVFAATDGVNGSCMLIESGDGGTSWTTISSTLYAVKDMVVYKDHLFISTATSLEVFGPLSATRTHTPNWKTASVVSDDWHQLIVGSDDILYMTNKDTVMSLTGFTAGSPPTGNFAIALDLPTDYRIKSVEQLGTTLVFGASKNTNSYGTPTAVLFPWDKQSASFDTPIFVNDSCIDQLLVSNNNLFAKVGAVGRFLTSNLSSTEEVKQLPLVSTVAGSNLSNYPNAVTNFLREQLFGISQGTGDLNPAGIYSHKAGAWILRNTVGGVDAYDGSVSTRQVQIYAIAQLSNGRMLIARRYVDSNNEAQVGIDLIAEDSQRYTDYTAYFETPLYSVGSSIKRKAYNNVEVRFAKPLVAGQQFRVSYRSTDDGTYVEIGRGDSTTAAPSGYSYHLPATMADLEYVQIKFEMGQSSSISGTLSPEFVKLRVT